MCKADTDYNAIILPDAEINLMCCCLKMGSNIERAQKKRQKPENSCNCSGEILIGCRGVECELKSKLTGSLR